MRLMWYIGDAFGHWRLGPKKKEHAADYHHLFLRTCTVVVDILVPSPSRTEKLRQVPEVTATRQVLR
jgi:hypothetical protein